MPLTNSEIVDQVGGLIAAGAPPRVAGTGPHPFAMFDAHDPRCGECGGGVLHDVHLTEAQG